MEPLGNDRWAGRFLLEENTRYVYTLEAWPDAYRAWAEDLKKRVSVGMDVTSELLEGAGLLRSALARVVGADRRRLEARLAEFDAASDVDRRARLLLNEEVAEILDAHPDRSAATRYDQELEVVADRPLARFAAWYELFPRSQSRVPGRPGTFDDCTERLPEIAAMGFDVIYLPPIHPIGRSFRKGPQQRAPGRSRRSRVSPWAIGNEQGGHKAIDPALGTPPTSGRSCAAAREHGIEIALDYALQCSPDHPGCKEHPEWFHHRPDGTIKYAENPPKKYQDIYPDQLLQPRARGALGGAARAIVLFWIEQGVRIFRVDNPAHQADPVLVVADRARSRLSIPT